MFGLQRVVKGAVTAIAATATATATRSFSTSFIAFGVKKITLREGNGKDFPKKGDKVTMHYTGTLTKNGNKFDSSVDRNEPFVTYIGVGHVIKGWDEGVPLMSLGEKAKLEMTYDYAYGERGYPPVIPAKSDLTFEVELIKIN
ncbi:hypothetical protein BC829DRAFT_365016 [Chytridium lagenaria]|nr:hypothetical protein BC829DRAFT_365016 [Chytridium lagenaria]